MSCGADLSQRTCVTRCRNTMPMQARPRKNHNPTKATRECVVGQYSPRTEVAKSPLCGGDCSQPQTALRPAKAGALQPSFVRNKFGPELSNLLVCLGVTQHSLDVGPKRAFASTTSCPLLGCWICFAIHFPLNSGASAGTLHTMPSQVRYVQSHSTDTICKSESPSLLSPKPGKTGPS
eukprot:3724309-Amphidinium_carterae.1